MKHARDYSDEELKKLLEGKKRIFIAGYTTLTDDEKKKADKLIQKLKKEGHEIDMGI